MLFCCENQFSFTKKSVCTWLTEQPLSQWMMAIIIKREDFSKQEWFACKKQEEKKKKKKNWFPSLFFSFTTQYSLGANMGLSFFHHDTSMLYMELSANFVIIHLLHIFTVCGPENDTWPRNMLLLKNTIFTQFLQKDHLISWPFWPSLKQIGKKLWIFYWKHISGPHVIFG